MRILWLAMIGVVAAGVHGASVRAQKAPFDAAASAISEQRWYSAMSPQLVASNTGDALTLAWQGYDGASQPASANVTQFARVAGAYTKAWEKQLPLTRLAGLTSDGTNVYALS